MTALRPRDVAATALCLVALSIPGATQASEGGGLNAASRVVPSLGAADRAAIVDELVERLRADPEILVETLLRYRQAEQAAGALGLAPAEAPATGSVDAAATVVEFVDYECAPCRATGSALDALAASGEIRVVHRDLPLSPEGVERSLAALQAHKSTGRYGDIRKALLKGEGVKEAAVVGDRAFASNLLKRNRADAARLGIRELPAAAVIRNGRMRLLKGEVGEAEIRAAVRSLGEG